ncbi:MAG: glycosyltransferase family 4 protein [Chloroflexi bacterium]|nr:glycosyltransferase family 4 protein [Chloroflexota bacterium]
MKILLAQNTDWLKRNPAQQHHLAEMLSLRGHEIRVIDFELLWRSQGTREFKSRRQVFENVSKAHRGARVTVIRPPIIKVPLLDYLSLFYSQKKEIDRQIKEFAPDIIVSPGMVSYLAGKAAEKHRLPFVFYWIDVIHRLIPFKFLRPLGWLIERRSIKMADTVLAINDELRDYVIGMGCPPEKIRVVRAGIELERFDLSLNNHPQREKYGLSGDDLVIFFMGWLYHFSGLKETALALSRLQDPKVKLLIVGEGDAYDELNELKEKYNLNGFMVLTGKKPYDEIPAHVAMADVCVLPAYNNDIMRTIVPIKLYEYMAMAKPVVSTRLPGVMREFGDNNGVVYVDRPEDVLARAVELVRDGSAATLGKKARQFAERLSWAKVTDGFEQILKETIAQKKHQVASSK